LGADRIKLWETREQKPMKRKVPLTLVSGSPLTAIIEPPAGLGSAGAKLWRIILRDFDISDAAGLILLVLRRSPTASVGQQRSERP
jgi:hypothetical protein